ncbi:alkaline phosphatase [uncultured Bacteroides sp.]|uniref:alkaline phosphatase n=1 Tax=uncultured Bacteroides sp. TaxID=162156 RepID=UPI002AA668C5|nr:alkaline phosphatase [uncultured Bacteroides sp.]
MKRFVYALIFVLVSGVTFAQGQAKYVFFFIGDGMGVNQVNGTEMYLAEKDGRIGATSLLFTQFPAVGVATTFSSSNSVTDSAAAGTALSTGTKTYNGAIGLDAQKNRLTTIAEKAKKAGNKVGVATTVSIDHATPAVFYAHQAKRSMYYEIATDLPKSGFDFFAGSGFLKPDKSFDEKDAPSVFPMFEKAGYILAKGFDDFKQKAPNAKKMILMAREGASAVSLPYAIDSKKGDLTLAQITEAAISVLTKDNKKGFFVMLEGGKIDWACHNNDAATAFDEVVDMDNAIKVAYEFYKKHPKETLIVITADHETGGIGLGTGKYELNLKALQFQKESEEVLSTDISALRKSKGNQVSWDEVKALLSDKMGFWTKLPLSWEQEKKLRDEYENSFVKNKVVFEKSEYAESEPLAAKAKEVMDEIAMVGWISGNHTAGYAPVFAVGAGSNLFIGKMDNTDICKRMEKAAGY